MTIPKIQVIESAGGDAGGVFVPIDVWRDIETRLRPAPNGNGAIALANEEKVPLPKPRCQRPLTPEQMKQKEEYDRIYATEDNRLDPVMAEIQARSLYSGDEW